MSATTARTAGSSSMIRMSCCICPRLNRYERQAHMEGAATAELTLDQDLAAVLLHNPMTDEQPQPHTGEAPVVDVVPAMKAGEELRNVVRWDTDPVIGHAQMDTGRV